MMALDAVVRSKLIYGTDAMQLNEPDLKRIRKIHSQAMRKLLNWDTTYLNKENTNKTYTKKSTVRSRIPQKKTTEKETNKTRKPRNLRNS